MGLILMYYNAISMTCDNIILNSQKDAHKHPLRGLKYHKSVIPYKKILIALCVVAVGLGLILNGICLWLLLNKL